MESPNEPMTATEALRRHHEFWKPVLEKMNQDISTIFDVSKVHKVLADAYQWKLRREPAEEEKAIHRAMSFSGGDGKRFGHGPVFGGDE